MGMLVGLLVVGSRLDPGSDAWEMWDGILCRYDLKMRGKSTVLFQAFDERADVDVFSVLQKSSD
jgi:tRNA pseudouridine-54 N-methylase